VKSRQLGVYELPDSQASGLWGFVQQMAWRYRCSLHASVCKLAALLLTAASLATIWSEATIFTGTKPDLSPFSLLIR